jgi:hypothetical protein
MNRDLHAGDRANQRSERGEGKKEAGRALAQPRSGRWGGCDFLTGDADFLEGHW